MAHESGPPELTGGTPRAICTVIYRGVSRAALTEFMLLRPCAVPAMLAVGVAVSGYACGGVEVPG